MYDAAIVGTSYQLSQRAIAIGVCAVLSATLHTACNATPAQQPGSVPSVPIAALGSGGTTGGASSVGGGQSGTFAAGTASAEPPVAGSSDAGSGALNEGCGDVPADYFAPTCTFVVCHDGQSGNALDLLSPGLPQRLIGVASTSLNCKGRLYIDPQAPEQSLLVRKLDPDRPCGDRMPPAGMATPTQRACLLSWIKKAVAVP